MGVAVSGWRLARAVSRRGQLGVVSGTGLDSVFVRRLQDGDRDGALRRAMDAFPIPEVAARAFARYFRSKGRDPDEPYQLLPMYRLSASKEREALTMIAAFCEVYLAKEGHAGLVGINLLTKVQRPNLATLYGAMLAGVDCVLMGAGIPREIPAVLDALAHGRRASLRLDAAGLPPGVVPEIVLNPGDYLPEPPMLKRPSFLPIVASNSLAAMLAHKLGAGVDGFVVEGPTAGGHNAPPRGLPQLNARGEPIYGSRDEVDLDRIRQLGLPFWLAGGMGDPDQLRRALATGAAGIQVGTLFAFCDESGVTAELKESILASAVRGEVDVITDPAASPTGYPFKVVAWSANPAPPEARVRTCDLGYLRVAYARPDGRIGYRCASEPVDDYVAKGGDISDTIGRRCLCNALMANVGIGQRRDNGKSEEPLLTSGDDLKTIASFLRGRSRYSADDVINHLLAVS
jgi:NAD(P)H-dependent flavin oxidoreductase YrpB (nitropropane dioxygenase family)